MPEAQLLQAKKARLVPKSRAESLLKSRDGGKRKHGEGNLLGGTVMRIEPEERSRAANHTASVEEEAILCTRDIFSCRNAACALCVCSRAAAGAAPG